MPGVEDAHGLGSCRLRSFNVAQGRLPTVPLPPRRGGSPVFKHQNYYRISMFAYDTQLPPLTVWSQDTGLGQFHQVWVYPNCRGRGDRAS